MAISEFSTQSYYSANPQAPILVCAFSGWNDSGSAATDALEFLNLSWQAEPLPGFDVSAFYDYSQVRPQLSHVAGMPVIQWPSVSVHRLVIKGRKIITLIAPEPSLQWLGFTEKIFNYARSLGVENIVLLGALLDEFPHTHDFPLSVTSYCPELQKLRIPAQTYTGPTGIVGVLAAGAQQQKISDLSIWVSVPHYAGDAPQPKASYELLKALAFLLDLPLNLQVLEEEKEAWERGAQELMEEEPELAAYVKNLENLAAETNVSGEDIAAAFEQFLKGKDS